MMNSSKTPKIYVISGGPATGKTAVINELKKRGYKNLPESARYLSEHDKRFKGKNILEINKKEFEKAIFRMQKEQFEKLKNYKEVVFSDRGIEDTFAYAGLDGVHFSKKKKRLAKGVKYMGIFIMKPLNFYKKDKLRQESKKEQRKIQKAIIKSYKNSGYKIIKVPFMTIKQRADFILKKIGNTK